MYLLHACRWGDVRVFELDGDTAVKDAAREVRRLRTLGWAVVVLPALAATQRISAHA